MPEAGDSDSKRMRLRFAGKCRVCAAELPASTEAIYERPTRTVRCLEHESADSAGTGTTLASAPVVAKVEPGRAGASARREFERRRAAREDRIRMKHPRLGRLVLAVTEPPQSTTAWAVGAVGEERLGARLDELAGDSLQVLHDRRIPESRGNIDHLAVAPSGVFVIDAKRYKGRRPRLQIEGGILRPRVEKLIVGGRDRNRLVDAVLNQVAVIRDVVGPDVPVKGVLCFVEADWPLIGAAFSTRGVDVLWPNKLYRVLSAAGPLTVASVREVHQTLATALPPA